ncbi:MAG: type II toxin-antitoxin system RelE/ParE family toxin [Candidatus Aminicenantes bacterium]|nr:type II toxin-antitoxin system RelE/ParE family toxin [Candidatus Aminicenantes bacterium]
MKVIQSPLFERKVKKFRKNQKLALDEQIRIIKENPGVGQEKKGDLQGVFVFKFKLQKVEYLLSYRFAGDNLELITLGPHENYYRDLKKHLKNK